MTKTKKTAIITLFIALLLSIAAAVALTFAPKQTFADSLIPEGYTVAPYQVLDLSTQNLTGSSAVSYKTQIGNEKAVRFKMTMGAGSVWGTVFGMNCAESNYYTSQGTEKACSYYYIKSAGDDCDIKFNILTNTDQSLVFNKVYELSTELKSKLSTANSVLNVEIGSVDVMGTNNVKAGTLIYLEVDGNRVAEYYYDTYSTLPFTGGYFQFDCNSTAVTLDTVSDVTELTSDNASVTFAEDGYDCKDGPVTPAPIVTVNKTVNGITYPQIVDAANYEVAYANNDVKGTGTATVTFKGIYSGTASGNFTVTKTERIIPTGYTVAPYSVLDLEQKTLTGESAVNAKVAIGNEKAVRFKMTMGAGSVWGTVFGMNCAESNYYTSQGMGKACYYFYINNNSVLGPNIKFTIVTNTNQKLVDGKEYELSSDLMNKLTTAGSVLNVEIGGVDVMGTDNVKAGTLIYLEVDGNRVAEYYYDTYSTLPFTGGYFQFDCNSTAVTLDTVTDVTDLTGKASVTFAQSEYDCSFVEVEPKPVVTATKTVGVNDLAVDYTEMVNEKYYDVTYENNTTAGTATATVTFKDKYSGSVSVDYSIVAITLTSDTDETKTILALSGATVELGRLSITDKTFIGYDVGGSLKESTTVVAAAGATAKFVTADFYTVQGASIKADGTRGLRFDTRIKTSEISRLEQYGTVTFGTKVYSNTLNKSGEQDSTKWAVQDEDGYSEYRLVLYNFESHDDYYTEKFSAKGYIRITPEGGETIKVYVDSTEFERSMADVADAYLENAGIVDTNPLYDASVYTGTYNNLYYAQTQTNLDYIVSVAAKKQSGITE